MKRAHILDSYYGEGNLDTSTNDWPNFDGLYLKLSHGGLAYSTIGGTVGARTRQIAGQHQAFETIGGYHYPVLPASVNWKIQAEAYLKSADALDKMGVKIHYDVLDVEKSGLVNENGYYPKSIGSAMYEFYKYVVGRTQRPFYLYANPYTYRDCFINYGYTWVNKIGWIVAQYPYRYWAEGLDGEAISGTRQPGLFPSGRARWDMWQYSDKYPAGAWFPDSKEADVNVWNGTIEDMKRELGITDTPAPPAPPEPTPKPIPPDPNPEPKPTGRCIDGLLKLRAKIDELIKDCREETENND